MKQRRYYSAFALTLSLLLVGCTTLHSVPLEERSRLINAPYDVTFQAAMEALLEAGLGIAAMDKDTGLIVTEYQVTQSPYRTRSNIMLARENEGQTRVTIRFDYNYLTVEGQVVEGLMRPETARRLYKQGLDSIESRALIHAENQ